jgi:two-component system response regulator GlrR
LVVEDDPDFRDALADNLREDGYRVYCYDGPESVPPAGTLPDIDLVVADATPSANSGMAFAEAWHRAHPEVPVLVLTSDPARGWDAWADRLGGVEVRRKPIDYERIRSTLSALCARLGA